jgi:glycosyltransferase involved in cell wall biosynthesis
VFSTTLQEGLGSVLIEALAAGLPVVASDVPACRETLRAGRWGRLVPPSDPVALASALAAAVGSCAVSQPTMEERRIYAAGFSPDRMIDDYLKEARL